MIKVPLASGKFYFEKNIPAFLGRVCSEYSRQGETTNLQTAEGMILTPKDGKN